MTRRRERPLPNLAVSLESLPAPENVKRDQRVMVRFTKEEFTKVVRAASERGEQPTAFLRTIALTAFQNSAMRALGEKPDLLDMSPTEQQRVLLEAFASDKSRSRRPGSPEPLPPSEDVKRDKAANLSFTKGELAMIERAAKERREQPAVFLRTLVLTVLQNSALRAQGKKPEMSPTEQQKALLEAFTFEE